MNKFLLILLAISTISVQAQVCGYFPDKVGTILEIQSFDSKGKLQITNTSEVKALDAGKITIDAKVVDNKNKPVSSMTYSAVCQGGNLLIDGEAMVPATMMEGKNDAVVTVTGDKMIYPEKLSSGSILPDANMNIVIEMKAMPFPFKSNMKITNRKVEGEEDITVPAGTFHCLKISYDMDYKMIVNMKGRGVEWICPGKGFIKSESYNKSNKMMGYSVRTK